MHGTGGSRMTTRRRARRVAAIGAARLASSASALAGHHGTALPGYLAERIDPSILPALADRLAPVVLVVGANGKTTTTRLISRILERTSAAPVATNRSGANLRQGVTTALLEHRRGRSGFTPAVLEVDELAFRTVARDLRPTVVVILNLLRDQLDRYGEIDAIAERWRADLAALPRGTTLVTCADDPRVESLAAAADRRVARFGLTAGPAGDSPADLARIELESATDPLPCPRCGNAVVTDGSAVSGLGPWRCPACGLERRDPDLEVRIDPRSEGSGWLVLQVDGPLVRGPSGDPPAAVRVRLAGTAGAYDTAAALLAAITLGISAGDAIAAVDGATPAFGRLEEIEVAGRHVVLSLAKNPASVAESAAAIATRHPDGILIGLADRPADGRDVSWIWDAPLDRLAGIAPITVTGSRADDLALRFKYARGPRPVGLEPLLVEPAIEAAFDAALERVGTGGTLMVMGTYTALLGIRSILERRGLATARPR